MSGQILFERRLAHEQADVMARGHRLLTSRGGVATNCSAANNCGGATSSSSRAANRKIGGATSSRSMRPAQGDELAGRQFVAPIELFHHFEEKRARQIERPGVPVLEPRLELGERRGIDRLFDLQHLARVVRCRRFRFPRISSLSVREPGRRRSAPAHETAPEGSCRRSADSEADGARRYRPARPPAPACELFAGNARHRRAPSSRPGTSR